MRATGPAPRLSPVRAADRGQILRSTGEQHVLQGALLTGVPTETDVVTPIREGVTSIRQAPPATP